MGRIWKSVIFSLLIVMLLSGWKVVNAAPDNGEEDSPPSHKVQRKFREGELLVRFKRGVSEQGRKNFYKRRGSKKIKEFKHTRFQHVKIKKGLSVEQALREYRSDPDVELVGPNYIYEADNTPTDTYFTDLWGLHNTGQTGGTPDADIDAPEAWDITTGDSNTVVAILDTGIDYNHPDLIDNVWINPGEIAGNGVDDDGNGYIDDIHGIDTTNHDSDPMDDFGHGTHVAGIIGAAANNGMGVAGVNWNVKLLACKFIDENGIGDTAAALECLDYIKDLKDNYNVNVAASNNSWGSPDYDQILYDGINSQQDILFVAAAGNDSITNDVVAHYPSSFDLPNVLAVAATDHDDKKATFSNYGRITVDVGAPGVNILSTFPGNGFAFASGTSMATPYVAGLAALLKSQDQSRDCIDLKNLIMAGGDNVSDLEDATVSGKRINAYESVSCTDKPLLRTLEYPKVPVIGVAATVSVLSINCEAPVGPVTLTLSGGELVDMLDDGIAPDRAANDGIYSGTWIPTREIEKFTFTTPELTETFTVPQFEVPSNLLPFGSLDKPYSYTLEPTGGLPPYTWSLVAGSLPPGLTLDGSTGEISGIPTLPGEFVFTVLGQDSYQATTTQEFRLAINNLYELWAITHNVGLNAYGEGIAVDNDGNVYVAGSIKSSTGGVYEYDFLTLKYDSAGNLLWTATFDGGFEDRAQDIILDGNGNLYVTGYSYNDTDSDYLTVKYDASSGNEIWHRRYDNDESYDAAHGIAIDQSGSIYVTGAADYNFLTLKYDALGNSQIFAIYDNGYQEYGESVATDSAGNVYVSGSISPGSQNPNYGFITIKYDPAGNELWTVSNSEGDTEYSVYDTTTDSAGNLYIAGDIKGPENSSKDYLIIKLDPNGNELWRTTYDRGFTDRAYGIAVDNSGNVYVTGSSQNSSEPDCITLVLNADGEITGINGFGTTTVDWGRDVAIGNDGSIYLAGRSNWSIFTLKYVDHLFITTLSLPNGQIGIPYNQLLSAVRGLAPYTWTVVSGSLPGGLALNGTSGEISGTPTSAGGYAFTVQVEDANGLTAEQPLTITIQEPKTLSVLLNGSGTVTSSPAGITCPADCEESFLTAEPITLSASPSSGWMFDGWSGGGCSGTADCIVTMTDDTVVTATFTQLQSSQANFIGSPLTGGAPMVVSFTDLSTNSPTSWSWDFGDSQTSTEQHPVHVYETAGTYSVSLIASNSNGSESITKSDYIIVGACADLPVRAGGVYYPTLQEAYNAAFDFEVIEGHAVDFTEDLLFDRNVAVTLAGGNNCEYTNNAASTTINGKLTIRGGTVTVENIVIRSN